MEGYISIAVILTLNVTISLVGVIGNGFVIIAFISKRGLRTQSNYFMISLVILSFIHCAIFYPIQALMDIGVIVGQTVCFPIGCLGLTESVAITLCLLATSTERYIAICWPLTADNILTQNRIVATFVVIAAYSITSGIIFPSLTWIGHEGGAFNDKHSRCTLTSISPTIGYAVWMGVNWLAPIPIMFMIYCRIFFVVRRHLREINAQTPHLNTISAVNEGNNKIPPRAAGRNKVHPLRGQVEAEENEVNATDIHSKKDYQLTNDSLHSGMEQNHLERETSAGQNVDGDHGPKIAEDRLFEQRGQIQLHHIDKGNSASETLSKSLRGDVGHSNLIEQDNTNERHRRISSNEPDTVGNGSNGDSVSMATSAHSRGTTGTTDSAAAAVDGKKHAGQRKQRNRLFKREMKSAFVVFAIVVLYSLNFIPYVVYIFTNVVSMTPDFNQFAIIHAILFANYALNPYIYGFGNRKVRHTIKNMICRTRRDRRLGGLQSISETFS